MKSRPKLFLSAVIKTVEWSTLLGLSKVLTVLVFAFGPGSVDAADVVDVYSKQTNSIERVRMLKDLADVRQPNGKKSVQALINMGLNDQKPNVVEAAVLQIGHMKLKRFEDRLIRTYANANKTHRGYGERVRLSCLRSLGKIGGPKTARLLADALSKDQGTVQGGEILHAVRELKDPSLIEDLEEYADKMAAQIKAGKSANDNPMLFSLAKQHLAYAEETIEVLSDLKGGHK